MGVGVGAAAASVVVVVMVVVSAIRSLPSTLTPTGTLQWYWSNTSSTPQTHDAKGQHSQ